jgi:hypothetical protein
LAIIVPSNLQSVPVPDHFIDGGQGSQASEQNILFNSKTYKINQLL